MPAPGTLSGQDPHVCPACAGELVEPLRWTPAGAGCWVLRLRCPDCEHRCARLLDPRALERFEEQIEAGAQAMLRALRELVRANMADDVERFASALAADLILPEDF